MAKRDLENELERRCAEAGLTVEEEMDEFEDEDGAGYGQFYGWVIASKSKDFEGKAHLYHQEDVEFALTTEFEKFRPIPGYEAMWSLDGSIIEAELALRPPMLPNDHAFASLLRRLDLYKRDHNPKTVVITFPREADDPIVTLRFASPELLIWRTTSPAVHLIDRDALVPCIRIEGLHLRSPSDAKNRLESIGNGALLEIELRTSIAARLRTHYPWNIRISHQSPKSTLQRIVSAPEVTPMSLYMHARLETSSLAAKFLGFYQVLEYFFPRHSPGLKDKEINQLKRTLGSVVDAKELRVFIDSYLRAFYMNPNPLTTDKRIRLEDPNLDLREDAAQRIYSIRCRIVHTKEDPSNDVFIPFAAIAAELEPDIELVRFVSQKALCASARPL